MKKVQVLLSAYNGEHYIEEQIKSILVQSWPKVTVLVRDDGSGDRTVDIISRMINDHPGRIKLIEESNFGVVGSFFELLEQADPQVDYYCFCDQDDVWLPRKIESAMSRLESRVNPQEPAMVFTSTQLTDSELNPMGVWPAPPRRKPSFYNALVQNIAVGATITINRSARNLFLENKKPDIKKVLMHDWWFYLLCSAFGEVLYDSEPSMLYRQHGSNVVGGSNSIPKKLLSKWKSFKKHFGKHLLSEQALEFNHIYGELLSLDKRKELHLFLEHRPGIKARIHFLRTSKLYRQSRTENLLFKFLILIGYI